ncbi:MAG: DNA/RNA non-specific endonuclease [Andreesenia angusta]|nr:DNA/RNA non-specific endonuclease [Andreesenia angusta]
MGKKYNRSKRKYKKYSNNKFLNGVVIILLVLFGYFFAEEKIDLEDLFNQNSRIERESKESFDMDSIPEFSGEPYIVLNSNVPEFTEDEKRDSEPSEFYSELDELGRVGVAEGVLGIETMPTEKRGSIGSVKPTGWHTIKYDNIKGKYLYNRCHLIGYQLSAENANKRNLMTGTRYFNVDGMLPFENLVADYIKETNNHVRYRVTPIFKGNNLLAHGLQMEAYSIEDMGEGISFNIYCYNNQPGIKINYVDGSSEKE